MLSDGTKAKEVEETIATYDVAELLAKAVLGGSQVEKTVEYEELLT